MKALICYMPVLHQGYLDFIDRHPDADALLIFGQDIINRFDWLKRKEIRAVDPRIMSLSVCAAVRPGLNVYVMDEAYARLLKESESKLVFADEEESREVARQMFAGCDVSFDKVFLRWDRTKIAESEVVNGFPIASERVHQLFMQEASEVSQQSSDWWRQVGAVLVSGDKKIVACNRHIPSDHTPYVVGDPRNLLKRGVGIEITSVLHSEAAVIAQAAREGVSTVGARLYVTTFPCPYCANVLAHTGISELYFSSGYSVLDGAGLLERAGIKIFQVVDQQTS